MDADISPWIALAIVIFCLALSAFFSGAETALTAASRARMHALESGGDGRAKTVNKLLHMRERLIGAMLIGNNIVNIGASAFTTSVLVAIFGAEGVIYATIAMSILVIIFSEVLPKTVAINSPDRTALLMAKPVAVVVALLGPLTMTIEATKGLNMYYMVNDGGIGSYRTRIRTPSFIHIQAISFLSRGLMLADFTAVVATTDFVMADVDR